MKTEIGATVKIRPRQSFDAGSDCTGLPGVEGCIDIEPSHVATILVDGHVVIRLALCNEHARKIATGVDVFADRRPVERRQPDGEVWTPIESIETARARRRPPIRRR